MKVIRSTKIMAFDVDNTLVFSTAECPDVRTSESIEIEGRKFFVHTGHIQIMKDCQARGHAVLVWSAGGHAWAEKVIEVLKLEDYVDYIMDKPSYFFDDKPSSNWLPESARRFIPVTGFNHDAIG